MKKKLLKFTFVFFIIIIFLYLALIISFSIFNKEKAYRYFPKDYKYILKINNYDELIYLNKLININKNNIFNKRRRFLMKLFPKPDSYVVVDKNNKIYLFSELSYMTGVLKRVAKVKNNIFCYTNNSNFKLKKTNFIKNNENFKKYINISDNNTFIIKLNLKNKIKKLENNTVYGDFNVRKKDNLIKLNYYSDYKYEDVKKNKEGINYKLIPDRLDMYTEVNIKNFEKHYSSLRKLFKNTKIFKDFLETKKNIHNKTEIDIELDLLPLINKTFAVGAKNINNYFMVLNQENIERIYNIEKNLENKYPVKFVGDKYNKVYFRTVNLKGFLGFLTSGILKNKMDKIKKPYYLFKENKMIMFDNYNFIKSYIDTGKEYNLKNSKEFNMYKKLINKDYNIFTYLDNKHINNYYNNKFLNKYVKEAVVTMDFNKKNLTGNLLIKLKN